MSKRKRYAAEEIIAKLREAEVHLAQGDTVGQAVRKLGVSEQTYYRWRREYGGMRVDQAKRLKELERENARLKQLVAEQALDNSIVREVASGKLLSPAKRRRTVAHARAAQQVSERRACRVIGQARATQASRSTRWRRNSERQ